MERGRSAPSIDLLHLLWWYALTMKNLQLEHRAEAAEKRSDELARANKRLRTQSEKAEKVGSALPVT